MENVDEEVGPIVIVIARIERDDPTREATTGAPFSLVLWP